MFKYPDYVLNVERGQKINRSARSPVYISLLKIDDQKNVYEYVLDLRIWRDDQPTACGVFIRGPRTAEKCIKALEEYISKCDEEPQQTEKITDVLGYNPFEEE